MSSGILQLQNIGMKFQSGDFFIEVLKDVNFSIHVGESVALLGQSGSGKSTLLQIAALLEQPTSGSVIMSGVNIQDTSEEKRTKLRRENLGFVYQFHNLLPEFSALENVMIPQLICGVKRKDAEQKAKNLLEQVELSHRLDKTPKTLSGGEQQRVAIARALANSPNLIIADEPTGNLDPQNAEVIFNLLLEIVQKNKASVLLATHNVELAKKLSRTILLNNGTLSSLN
ncbi:MAG: ABC transporter ATP-binding protein [Alphaproteobacteria bacterium]|nr:ABC transporter ATP-binding protein [Alphaproteobacteria bacterium]